MYKISHNTLRHTSPGIKLTTWLCYVFSGLLIGVYSTKNNNKKTTLDKEGFKRSLYLKEGGEKKKSADSSISH